MKPVILIGGGYSLKEGIEKGLWEQIKNQEIWSVNYAFMTMPYLPKREVWVDPAFFRNNIVTLQALSEKNVEMVARDKTTWKFISKIKCYNTTTERDKFFGREAIKKNCIYRGGMGLSGVFALSLAVAEGFQEIFLLGYDFGTPSLTENFTHFYQNKLKVESTGMGRPKVYRLPNNELRTEIEDFKLYLPIPDLKIWNVSLTSNISCFDKISFEIFFNKMSENG